VQKGKEVYRDMEQWLEIRKRVLREGVSKRQILRETGMHWTTLEKILQHSCPPDYQRTQIPHKPKMGPYLERVRQILEEDRYVHKKQRHTAKRIWQRLQEEGFTGGYTIVKDAVRQIKRTSKEVFLPLKHPPGEAQVDFGYALVKMAGVLRKVAFFVMALPHSDAFFVKAYERECTETFWDGHVQAFNFFGGVPRRISYDNSRVMISKIIGPRERELTDGFKQLISHYLFDVHFCLVRRANEKGVVEGLVKYARQNFMVPVPQVRDFAQLNAMLLQGCQNDLRRRVRGHSQNKEQVLLTEQLSFLSLPFAPFEACRTQPGRVNSELLVRFDDNDYSVPMEYAYQDVVVKGDPDSIKICRLHEVIAVHQRCWAREQQIFNPYHYLPLLERKPHALPFAKPFDDWELPRCFEILHERMCLEQEHGTREYIGVLRLLETHSLDALTRAVEQALRRRITSKEGVEQFLPGPQQPPTFLLDGRRHLRLVQVCESQVSVYTGLLERRGVI
jgi:transposase